VHVCMCDVKSILPHRSTRDCVLSHVGETLRRWRVVCVCSCAAGRGIWQYDQTVGIMRELAKGTTEWIVFHAVAALATARAGLSPLSESHIARAVRLSVCVPSDVVAEGCPLYEPLTFPLILRRAGVQRLRFAFPSSLSRPAIRIAGGACFPAGCRSRSCTVGVCVPSAPRASASDIAQLALWFLADVLKNLTPSLIATVSEPILHGFGD